MPVTIDGSLGITTPMYNGSITANAVTPVNSFKNRIINGNMSVDQRNAGASVTVNGSSPYTLDRWQAEDDTDGVFTVQQDAGAVTPPAGFTDYLGVTTTTADSSLAAGQYSRVQQCIEGYNIADLAWGTASASPVTLSFWVRSSLTGTFGGALQNGSFNRSYPFTYTISAANTWEQKSITIAGDTTGTWSTTNGRGLFVQFGLGVGSTYSGTAGAWAASNLISATGATSVIGTLNATWYITGVQLEVGSTATSFDYRPYGTELALCQRYFYLHAQGNNAQDQMIGTALVYSASQVEYVLPFKTTMRTSPSLYVSNVSNTFGISNGSYTTTTSTFTIYGGTTNSALIYCTPVASGTTGVAVRLNIASAATSSTYIGFSAEL
jgi:hypothetical protein